MNWSLKTGYLAPVGGHTWQFVIFKPLSYCFEKTIGFDVKASFAICPLSRLIRRYNKPGDITKEFWEKAIQFHETFHGLKITNWWYRFSVTSECLLSRKVSWAVRIGSLCPKIEVFYRPEWTKEGTMKMNFEHFQIQKCYKQSRKSSWKNGSICIVSMFPSSVMVLKLSKKVHFLQFCADLSKKSILVCKIPQFWVKATNSGSSW